MKERFQVENDNIKYNVLIRSVGRYEVFFPTRYDENGNKILEYMYRDSENKMWILTSKSPTLPEYFYCLAYLDNGEVGWTDRKDKKAEWLEGKFNPYVKTENKVQQDAQKMHGIISEIHSYEKLVVPTDKINELREDYLTVLLKLCGYMSPDHVKYGDVKFKPVFGLKELGDALKKYISLSRYTYRSIIRDEVFEGSKVTNKEMRDEAVRKKDELEKNVIEVNGVKDDLVRDLVERRSFESSYATNMRRKLPEREWNIYFNTATKLAKLVMGLNYDLLDEVDRNGIENLTGIDEKEIAKRVEDILKSKEYKEACNIENWFIKRACISLIEGVKEAEKEDKLGTIGDGLKKLRNKAMLEQTRREGLIEEYRAEKYDR